MTFPPWALTRNALITYGVTIGLAALFAGVKIHDHNVRQEEAARIHEEYLQARLKHEYELRVRADSLRAVETAKTNVVIHHADVAVRDYNAIRAQVDTKTPTPPGTLVPEGSVVVPVEFVEKADSLASLVTQLMVRIDVERKAANDRIAASDSLVATLQEEVKAVKLQAQLNKPTIVTRAKDAALLSGAVYLSVKILASVLRHNSHQ